MTDDATAIIEVLKEQDPLFSPYDLDAIDAQRRRAGREVAGLEDVRAALIQTDASWGRERLETAQQVLERRAEEKFWRRQGLRD